MKKLEVARVVQEDLKRIFEGCNPLDFICDASLVNNEDVLGELPPEMTFELTLRIPQEFHANVVRLFEQGAQYRCSSAYAVIDSHEVVFEEYNAGIDPNLSWEED